MRVRRIRSATLAIALLVGAILVSASDALGERIEYQAAVAGGDLSPVSQTENATNPRRSGTANTASSDEHDSRQQPTRDPEHVTDEEPDDAGNLGHPDFSRLLA